MEILNTQLIQSIQHRLSMSCDALWGSQMPGITVSVEVAKRVKQWWFVADNGKLCLSIRYGSKLLELGKGKSAVELANGDEIIRTLEIVQSAVMSGELDAQIESASGSLRAGFKR